PLYKEVLDGVVRVRVEPRAGDDEERSLLRVHQRLDTDVQRHHAEAGQVIVRGGGIARTLRYKGGIDLDSQVVREPYGRKWTGRVGIGDIGEQEITVRSGEEREPIVGVYGTNDGISYTEDKARGPSEIVYVALLPQRESNGRVNEQVDRCP